MPETTEVEKLSWYNPKNLIYGIQEVFGTELDASEEAEKNTQGEIIWMTVMGYVLGNSLGTANEDNASSEAHCR